MFAYLRIRYVILLMVIVILPMAGCASRNVQSSPDLERIYADKVTKNKKHPVILIPGVMGSQLAAKKSKKEIWPGGITKLITGSGYKKLRLPVHNGKLSANTDALKPTALVDVVAGRNFYSKIIQTLEQVGKYRCEYPRAIGKDTNCVLFPWDWRRDIVESVDNLHAVVTELKEKKNRNKLTVDVVAHSAGGLLTRYYARYGTRDVLKVENPSITFSGARNIRRAILIATPNFGSIHALQRAVRGFPIGMTRLLPESLATMPGLYQTLPHPDRTFMINIHGEKVERDLYSLETWKNYEWSLFDPAARERIKSRFDQKAKFNEYYENFKALVKKSLERAERFHRALSKPIEEAPLEYVIFGSSCKLTPATCLVEKVNGRTKVRLYPDNVENRIPGVNYEKLMLAPGDGSVTKASLLSREQFNPTNRRSGDFPIEYSVFICEKHTEYPSNITFRNNLMNLLVN